MINSNASFEKEELQSKIATGNWKYVHFRYICTKRLVNSE